MDFDWEEKSQVWAKVEEEMQEFKNEFNAEDNSTIDHDKAESEFGDLLFSLINYARFININPEDALEKTNRKFIKRFQYLESKAAENGEAATGYEPYRNGCFLGRSKKAIIVLTLQIVLTGEQNEKAYLFAAIIDTLLQAVLKQT